MKLCAFPALSVQNLSADPIISFPTHGALMKNLQRTCQKLFFKIFLLFLYSCTSQEHRNHRPEFDPTQPNNDGIA